MAESLLLAYAGLPITLSGPAPALDWIVEFLGPAFGAGEAATAAVRRVELVLDSEEFAARRRQLQEQPSRPLECFTLDGRFQVHPAADMPGSGTWFRDDAAPALVEVGNASRVRVVAPEDGPDVRVTWMRVIRELATTRAHELSWLPLHGATLRREDGRGVVLAGPKRSGKTTLLLYGLARLGARFVSNDRLFAAEEPEAWRVHGMPTVVSVREGTLAQLPALAARFLDTRHRFHRTLAESERGSPAARRRPDVTCLSGAQLCDLLGCEAEAQAPLTAVLLPRIDPSVEGLVLRKLDAAEAAARLLDDGLLLAARPPRPSPAFATRAPDGAPDGAPDPGALSARCLRLAQAVPCWEARLGPRVYAGATELERFLSEVAA